MVKILPWWVNNNIFIEVHQRGGGGVCLDIGILNKGRHQESLDKFPGEGGGSFFVFFNKSQEIVIISYLGKTIFSKKKGRYMLVV